MINICTNNPYILNTSTPMPTLNNIWNQYRLWWDNIPRSAIAGVQLSIKGFEKDILQPYGTNSWLSLYTVLKYVFQFLYNDVKG